MTIRAKDIVVLTIDELYRGRDTLYRVRFWPLTREQEVKELLYDFYPEEPLREFGWIRDNIVVASNTDLLVVHRDVVPQEIMDSEDYEAVVGYKVEGCDAGREEYIGLICPIEGGQEGWWLGYYSFDEWWDEGGFKPS